MKRSVPLALAGVMAATIGFSGAPSASAEDYNQTARAQLTQSAPQVAKYDDHAMLELLLAGQGPIAENHPELKRMLGFNANKPHTNEKALDRIIQGYLKAHPNFNKDVTVPFQSGDPEAIQVALRDFSMSFNAFLKENGTPVKTSTGSNAGWTYMGAYVVVYMNALAVANAAAYTNVGVATMALATLAVVTWYLEDGTPVGSEVERDALVNTIATELS